MELAKVNEDNATLHAKYSRLVQEWDEDKQREGRLKNAMKEVYSNFPEIPMEVYIPLEEKVMKISEAIQAFHLNIVDLEARTTPSTPPKEREKREKTTAMTVESIKILDE
jgi:hypothetical protein